MQDSEEVGVTVKGSYFPPGKEPKEEGERKLYLFIEATSELSLNRAKAEVVRVMKESMQMMVGLSEIAHHMSTVEYKNYVKLLLHRKKIILKI